MKHGWELTKYTARKDYKGLSRRYRTEYNAYIAMIHRCYNEKCHAYYNYGARGIKVSDEWRKSFKNFLDDVGLKPSKGHSLDRIDNNGNYCKENCKWSTRVEQENNKRTNVKIKIDGKLLNAKQIAEMTNMEKSTINKRIKAGIANLETLSAKRLYGNKIIKINYNGQSKTINEWADELGINANVLRARLFRNLPVERAFQKELRSKK